MVDVTGKSPTVREAVATASVKVGRQLAELIQSNGGTKKGDVLKVAEIAGVAAAKRTSELIPLCHNIPLTAVAVSCRVDEPREAVEIRASVRCEGKTGVEMEALTAASVAALTVYDMCKAVDKGIVIAEVRLVRKSGGKSGEFFNA
ncbi:unnamed protein product [Phyllotreta striolata]|uniref:cyclic pyranopterin monophosphate synthase n=1 Tax=Phyllotreta striolata TaxID=444603 RepID=A0A9N9THP6_PHYSR|nr:unnamed protein product [Phyllotreta striolata]